MTILVIFSLPETHVVTHLQVASKLDAADKTSIEEKISETIAWLDANQTAEKEEFEEKQKELEACLLYTSDAADE